MELKCAGQVTAESVIEGYTKSAADFELQTPELPVMQGEPSISATHLLWLITEKKYVRKLSLIIIGYEIAQRQTIWTKEIAEDEFPYAPAPEGILSKVVNAGINEGWREWCLSKARTK